MNRRRLLRAAGAALVGGLAGCSDGTTTGRRGRTATATGTPRDGRTGTSSPAGSGTPTDHPTPTDGPTPTDQKPVERPLDWSPGVAADAASVTVADTVPDETAPVRYDVGIDPGTGERPPVLRTRITNTADRTVSVGEGRFARHDGIRSVGEELFLLATGMARSTDGDCWGVEGPMARDTAYEVIDLGPGGTATGRSYVLGVDREAGDCLPLGRHRFEPRVCWSEAANQPGPTEGTRIDWAFTLRVERRG